MEHQLLHQLKHQTQVQHETLERRLDLLRPEMSLEDYRILLEGFYGFYAPWEQHAAPLLYRALPGFFEERRKTPLLERDLRVLKSNPSVIPRCYNLPNTASLQALLGSLYVLEGATLGGQILSRHFGQRFNLSCENGSSFFCSYGPNVGPRWRAFCNLLGQYSSPNNNAAIVQSAVETFSCLGEWLVSNRVCQAQAGLLS